jgi:hypothetical protein
MSRGVRNEDRSAWSREHEAHAAQLEAKYGVPYEKLPEVLRYAPPEHPRVKNARRFDYRTADSRWVFRGPREKRPRLLARTQRRLGWRTERSYFLERVEKFRLAEIEVRKLRTKRTGRGKPLHRKALADAKYRLEAREWRKDA